MSSEPTNPATLYGNPTEWVERCGDPLLRYARSRVSGREICEDLVQETLLAAYRYRGRYDGKSAFGTWLVAILRHKIADHYRRIGTAAHDPNDPTQEDALPFNRRGKWVTAPSRWQVTPHQVAESREFWEIFFDCLNNLPAHLSQAFQIREMGTGTADEAARLIGITPKNLAVRLHRTRLLLRDCLQKNWFQSTG